MATTTTTPTTTKKRQKAEHRREAAKALTPTTRSARHDYARLIGVKVKNPVDLVRHVEKGVASAAGKALQHRTDLPTKERARWLDVNLRTSLSRKGPGRLQPAESDRVL